ncbi:unnamed protein product [Nezara viridula]|uniref:Uncharacterized protein n=1 Tax=Nezara viridula TaxID=85310 RepID=A0A9P0MQN1_NEZVI|nr:unnamed protein product [Nezara viridula]
MIVTDGYDLPKSPPPLLWQFPVELCRGSKNSGACPRRSLEIAFLSRYSAAFSTASLSYLFVSASVRLSCGSKTS